MGGVVALLQPRPKFLMLQLRIPFFKLLLQIIRTCSRQEQHLHPRMQTKHSQHARSMSAARRTRKEVRCSVPVHDETAGQRAQRKAWRGCAYSKSVQCTCRGPLLVSTSLPLDPVQGPAMPPRRKEDPPPYFCKVRRMFVRSFFFLPKKLFTNRPDRDIPLVVHFCLSEK